MVVVIINNDPIGARDIVVGDMDLIIERYKERNDDVLLFRLINIL